MSVSQFFTIKQNDTRPAIQLTLPVDLTTASAAKFQMKKPDGTGYIYGACTFVDRPSGKVLYTWITGDTVSVGTYNAEVQVTWTDGGIETFPEDGYFAVNIVADLG